jgi:glycosyltransferase involved in cell wall biosynthesis
VPPGDAFALASAIRRVLGAIEVRERLVASGLERAEAFSMERLADRYVEYYGEAMARAGRA